MFYKDFCKLSRREFIKKSFILGLFFKGMINSSCSKEDYSPVFEYPQLEGIKGDTDYDDDLAFPGAEGFGRYSKGGRGGKIIKVTNLNDDGPGSLRAAVQEKGPRIVVFEVGGVIDLKTTINVEEPFITLAGQTAPSPGICLRGNHIRTLTNNVVIRFLRIRPGDFDIGHENYWHNMDSIGIYGGVDCYNIIVDHCSLSWSVDEVVGMWNEGKNITIQNSIISEALHDSKHPKGPHSKGILIGSNINKVSILNNLIMHNMERSPRVSNPGHTDVRNNIIYNPGGFAAKIHNSADAEKKQYVNFVRNIFVRGPNTNFDKEFAVYRPLGYDGKIYLSENLGFDQTSLKYNWNMVEDWEERTPLGEKEINKIKSSNSFQHKASYTKSFDEMYNYVKQYVGCSLPVRDNVDIRLFRELITGSGRIINSQDDVGGWPNLDLVDHIDFDFDKKLLKWLEKYNISESDLNKDLNGNGFTTIEEYLNGTNPIVEEYSGSIIDVFNAFAK